MPDGRSEHIGPLASITIAQTVVCHFLAADANIPVNMCYFIFLLTKYSNNRRLIFQIHPLVTWQRRGR